MARNPKCEECPLTNRCKYYKENENTKFIKNKIFRRCYQRI